MKVMLHKIIFTIGSDLAFDPLKVKLLGQCEISKESEKVDWKQKVELNSSKLFICCILQVYFITLYRLDNEKG